MMARGTFRPPRGGVMARYSLALLLLIAFATPAAAQAKQKVAFLVGVGEFRFGLANLDGVPQEDVAALARELRNGEFTVVVLTDKEATKENIEKRFKEV